MCISYSWPPFVSRVVACVSALWLTDAKVVKHLCGEVAMGSPQQWDVDSNVDHFVISVA